MARDASARPREVRAGPVTALLDGAFLRRIRVGPHELLRGVYAAVRDQNWGTVEPAFSRYDLEEGADSFRLRFTAEHRRGEIDFAWDGEYVGEPTGRIVFHFDGVCRAAFRKNRIGFCVLHPSELAGTPYVRQTPAGPIEERFPERISPSRDVTDMAAISYRAGPVGVELRFEGDLFDMEDQRNWTDGSLHRLGAAGAAALTYFETAGPCGVVDAAGAPYPVYDVLAAVAPHAGAELLEITLRDPLAVEALAFRGDSGLLILVANLTPDPCELAVALPTGQTRSLELGPYAVATIADA